MTVSDQFRPTPLGSDSRCDDPCDARSAERAFSVCPTVPPRQLVSASAPETLDDRVRALAEETVSDTDLYVVDVEVRGFKGSRVVSVYLDADGGAGVDDLATASRQLGFVLETEDVIDGKYKLEVSSPGATRPLQLARQYPRHVGRDLKVTYLVGADEVRATGELVAATDTTVTLQLPSGDALDIPFDDVVSAVVQLPW